MKRTSAPCGCFTEAYHNLNDPLTTAEKARAMVMVEEKVLNLAEMYFVLMLDERKAFIFHPVVNITARMLAQALLVELILDGDLRVIDNLCFTVPGRATACDPALNMVYDAIMQSIELKTLYGWEESLGAEGEGLVKRIADGLVAKGILSEEKKRIFSSTQMYRLCDQEVLYQIVMRLRNIGLYSQPPDEPSLALLRLAKQAGQLRRIFDLYEERIVREVIERHEAKSSIPLHR